MDKKEFKKLLKIILKQDGEIRCTSNSTGDYKLIYNEIIKLYRLGFNTISIGFKLYIIDVYYHPIDHIQVKELKEYKL
jgi:hypothetical protein